MQAQNIKKSMFDLKSEEEFWDYVRQGIEEGEDDIKNGRVYKLEDVIKEMKEKYNL